MTMATESEKRYGSLEEIKRTYFPNLLLKEQQEERERWEAEPVELPEVER
jgi:hypothetical protein